MSEAATIIERLTRSSRAARAARVPMTAAAASVLAAVALSGCASQPPPKPTAQLVRASTLITVAENDEAQRYAAADLQRAHDELSDAQTAEAEHQYARARALAENAAADADLAGARAASGKARESSQQVHRSLDTLRQQLRQSPTPSDNSDQGASGPGQDHR
jgi:flagellar biosynthesis/type III secretory pathway protein FliH